MEMDMETLLLTFGLMATVMAGMAVGVIFSNRELKGSCGGVGGSGDCACEEAGTPGACKDDPESPPGAKGVPQSDGTVVYGG
jgi:hypothetical protein